MRFTLMAPPAPVTDPYLHPDPPAWAHPVVLSRMLPEAAEAGRNGPVRTKDGGSRTEL